MPDFASISPHLNIRVSERAKRLLLRLDAQNRKVHLIIPKRASLKAAHAFAVQNRNWIAEKLAALPEQVPFHDGAILPVLGREYHLVIDHDDIYKLTKIAIEDDRIVVRTRLDNPSGRISRFLKMLAHDEFSRIASQKAQLIDRKIATLTLRDMRTRWGSCSKDGRMTLNWRLIFSPSMTYDYVIAHEVAHLTHSNHGELFWKLCERLSEDFSMGSEWIRVNSAELTRYGPMLPDPKMSEE